MKVPAMLFSLVTLCLLAGISCAAERARVTIPQTRPLTAACVLDAARAGGLPAAALFGILATEGGKTGEALRNSNGTWDMGPFQINTVHVDTLAAMGIDNADVSTDSLYIYANYDYSEGEGRIVSYSANNTLRVIVRDVNNTGAAIDAAFAVGANTLESVNFCASDDSAARDQAYRQAVAEAAHKAEIVAEAAGMQLGSIADISVGQGYDYYEAGNYARATKADMETAAGVPTDIQASGVLVSASVTITYHLIAK